MRAWRSTSLAQNSCWQSSRKSTLLGTSTWTPFMLGLFVIITLRLPDAQQAQVYIYHEFIDLSVAIPVHMTSHLRLPITGFGAEMFFLFLPHEVHQKQTTFCASKGKPSTKLYHPRMESSPRSLLRNPEIQERNNGKPPYMERQLDTGSMSHYTSL